MKLCLAQEKRSLAWEPPGKEAILRIMKRDP